MYAHSEGNVAHLTLQQFSLDAYQAYGFTLKKNSHNKPDENPALFELSTKEFIKIVEYGDSYNWGIYAKRILGVLT